MLCRMHVRECIAYSIHTQYKWHGDVEHACSYTCCMCLIDENDILTYNTRTRHMPIKLVYVAGLVYCMVYVIEIVLIYYTPNIRCWYHEMHVSMLRACSILCPRCVLAAYDGDVLYILSMCSLWWLQRGDRFRLSPTKNISSTSSLSCTAGTP